MRNTLNAEVIYSSSYASWPQPMGLITVLVQYTTEHTYRPLPLTEVRVLTDFGLRPVNSFLMHLSLKIVYLWHHTPNTYTPDTKQTGLQSLLPFDASNYIPDEPDEEWIHIPLPG